jgi:hypothetical protein
MTAILELNAPGTNSQQLPAVASSCQFEPIGLDVGNGAVKMASCMGEQLIESYVLYLSERATHVNKGYVEYLDGSRSDLAGKIWIGGINAYNQNPTGIARVTDDPSGKAQLCLQLLLSSLSHQSYRPTWNLYVAASVHDGKVFGKSIRSALEGTHHIRIHGKDCTVTVRIGNVLEEGAGVAYALKGSFDFTNALLFDLGNGTAIVSAFNGLQLTWRDYCPDAGVEKLIDAVATNDMVRAFLKRPADRHLIRQGIEKGDFSYGTRYPEWRFKDAYASELPGWFSSGLKGFVKASSTRIPGSSAVLAVGGGVCLPGVAGLLAKRDILVPQNARWLNAKGLYAIALRSVRA